MKSGREARRHQPFSAAALLLLAAEHWCEAGLGSCRWKSKYRKVPCS